MTLRSYGNSCGLRLEGFLSPTYLALEFLNTPDFDFICNRPEGGAEFLDLRVVRGDDTWWLLGCVQEW